MSELKTSDFYFDLPEELIAQDPLEDRASSRLLILVSFEEIQQTIYVIIAQLPAKRNLLLAFPVRIDRSFIFFSFFDFLLYFLIKGVYFFVLLC